MATELPNPDPSLVPGNSRLNSEPTQDREAPKQFRFVRKPTFDKSYFGRGDSMAQIAHADFSSSEYLAKLPWDLLVNNQSFNDFYLTSKVKNINDFQTKMYVERMAQKLKMRQLLADAQNSKHDASSEVHQAQKIVSLGMIGFVKSRIATLQSEKLERERVSCGDARLRRKLRRTAWRSSSRS